MTYLVLARKYRPKTLDEIVGQRVISQTLKNAILTGRISHAYIFSGMRGVGKTTTARVLAKSLNCVNGPTVNPCNECEFCVSIQEGRAIDVIEIDGASNRGIDDVRELREVVKFPPMNAKYKIVIIDEVHMLTTEAFNALLKTLEEPQPRVIFIMATTEFHKVPSTIVSRSQHFEFKRISEREIFDALSKIADKEGIKISPHSLRKIAISADGSLRDAEVFLDQVVSYSGNEVRDEDVDEILGITDRDTLFSVSSSFISGDGAKLIQIVDRVMEEGKDLRNFMRNVVDHFRAIYLAKITKKPSDFLSLSEKDEKKYVEEASKFTEEELFRYINILIQADSLIRQSFYPRYIVEATLLRLSYLKRLTPIEKIIEGLKIPEQKEVKKEEGTSEIKEEISEKKIDGDSFLNEIGKENPRLCSTMKLLPVISIEGKTLKLVFNKETEHLKETINKYQTYLENKLREMTGNDFLIILESKEAEAEKEEEIPPLLKIFLEEMNGKIISKKKIGKGEENEEHS
jgi:DNA polymerase-3 subunit gamma/tau